MSGKSLEWYPIKYEKQYFAINEKYPLLIDDLVTCLNSKENDWQNMLEKFASAVIRQVGRDLGKVVSNEVFGDRHSTPIRHVNKFANSPQTIVGTKTNDKRRKTNFEKSLNFRMSYTPKTLINKLMACFIEFKNESDVLISDGYISSQEAQYYFGMLENFSEKAANVAEVVEVNPRTTELENNHLNTISINLKKYVREIAAAGSIGCDAEIDQIKFRLSIIETKSIANKNLIYAGLTVSCLVVGYFLTEMWMILPLLVFGFMFWDSYKSLRKKNDLKELLQDRLKREIKIRNIFEDILSNDTYKTS